MEDIEAIIAAAAFTEWDCDTGISGGCAMFALALYRRIIHLSPQLVLVGGYRDGEIELARDGGYMWRHAAVKAQGGYYDIEGRQQPEWMIGNYLWSHPKAVTPAIIETPVETFIANVASTHTARDRRFYLLCKQKLQNA